MIIERPGRGRPTRAQQAQRREELLAVALDIFLERGFDQTKIEDIAAAVGMSKRTVYASYEDKATLFSAAVQLAISHYTLSRATVAAVETDRLEDTLIAVARLRIANVATPMAIKLQRILAAQSYRFPDLFDMAFELGAKPTVDYLEDLLKRRDALGEIHAPSPRRAAIAFLSLVVGGPARLIVSGRTPDEIEMEKQVRFAVDLFLNGLTGR